MWYTTLKVRAPFGRLRGLLLLPPDWQVRRIGSRIYEVLW